MSLGVEVNVLLAAIEQTRQRGALVVTQVNPRMPWTYGDGEIPLEKVDLGVEVNAPLGEAPVRSPSAVSAQIAARAGHGTFGPDVTGWAVLAWSVPCACPTPRSAGVL